MLRDVQKSTGTGYTTNIHCCALDWKVGDKEMFYLFLLMVDNALILPAENQL